MDDTKGVLSAFELIATGWAPMLGSFDAQLGRGGVTREKREGDERTPLGTFRLTEAFGFRSNPGTALPYKQLRGDEVWVNDPTSPDYNTLQTPTGDRSWRSAEALDASRDAYEWAVVVDYNRDPVIPNKGSAIFLHVMLGQPTSGCIAISRGGVKGLLRWLTPSTNATIAILG
jgi:L,D-peptidoglycan transpeptidase YkuD (ErfK/YbiS/YcfS/YnhG family)